MTKSCAELFQSKYDRKGQYQVPTSTTLAPKPQRFGHNTTMSLTLYFDEPPPALFQGQRQRPAQESPPDQSLPTDSVECWAPQAEGRPLTMAAHPFSHYKELDYITENYVSGDVEGIKVVDMGCGTGELAWSL